MKRDIDVIRRLLLDIESRSVGGPTLFLPHCHSGDDRTRHHVRLLLDGGFVEEVPALANGQLTLRLTDRGHEFLELSRNDQVWEKAKQYVRQQTGGMSITALAAILSQWALEAVGQRGSTGWYAARPAHPAPVRGVRYYTPSTTPTQPAPARTDVAEPNRSAVPLADQQWHTVTDNSLPVYML